ncbi:MAG: T9SS C-terminal target domain-containing protein, partial [Bacteroidia bacterium]
FNYYNFFGGGRPGLGWDSGVNFWDGDNVYFEFAETADGYNLEIHIPYTHFEAQDGFELSEEIALEIQVADVDALLIEDQAGKTVVFNNTIYPGSNWNEPCWWGLGVLLDFPADDDDDDQDQWQEKSYEINQVFDEITVDGYMDEDFWASAPWEDLVKIVDEDEEEWDDADLSGRFKMVWHEDHGFYVFVEVMDDILIDRNDVIDANPDEDVDAWHADMVEVNIRPQGRRPGYDPDDPDLCRYDEHTFQFRFNYYNFFGGGRPGLGWDSGVNFWDGDNVYFEFAETADGYNLEIHIPYTHFEAQDGFELADEIALELQVIDKDHLIIEDQNGRTLGFNNTIHPGQNWNEPCWWGKGVLVESDEDVSVEPIDTAEKIKVYPNPASDQLYVANIENAESLRVIDLLGNTLLIETLDNNQGDVTLDISQLKSGVYFLLTSGAGTTQTIKFIKH